MGILVAGASDGTTYLSDPYIIRVIIAPVGNRYYGHMRVPPMWGALPSAGVVNGEVYQVGYETYRFIP